MFKKKKAKDGIKKYTTYDLLIGFCFTSYGRYFKHFRKRIIDQSNRPCFILVRQAEPDVYNASSYNAEDMPPHSDTLF